jgi:hypothetical protein
MMKPREAVLLVVLLIVVLVIVSLLPANPLGVPCMDAWCLNGNQPFNP